MPDLTPFQTVGPFFAIAYPSPESNPDAGDRTRVRIEGTVRDGQGRPVPEALIETWQADPSGRYAGVDRPSGRGGFSRFATDDSGRFALETIKPGRVPGPGADEQAPHILVAVCARGILTRLVTRIYFDDEDNRQDSILLRVPAPRRGTLVARRRAQHHYEFDIVLQGATETVFFDV